MIAVQRQALRLPVRPVADRRHPDPRPTSARASAGRRESPTPTRGVERSRSVSSMRRMNVPPAPRASSQLKSAVRALPTCRWPVGLGAKRTRMCEATSCTEPMQGQDVSRRLVSNATAWTAMAFAAAGLTHAFVRFALDADRAGLDAERAGEPGADRVGVRRQLGLLRDDDGIHVHDCEARVAHDRQRPAAAAPGCRRPSIADRCPESDGRCRRVPRRRAWRR